MANPFVILAVASSFGKAYATYQAGMAQKAYYDSQAAVSRLQYKSKENFTLKHFQERINIYNEEEFDYEIHNINLKD